MQIWTVGGGKGGTGKSFVAAGLGVCLAERGYRVIRIWAYPVQPERWKISGFGGSLYGIFCWKHRFAISRFWQVT